MDESFGAPGVDGKIVFSQKHLPRTSGTFVFGLVRTWREFSWVGTCMAWIPDLGIFLQQIIWNVFGRAQPTRDQDGEGGQVFWSETSSKNQVSQLSSWCFANNALPRKDKDDASVVLAVIKVQVILKFWILLECRNVVILTCALQLYSAWLTLKGERLKRAAVSLLESLASLALEVKAGREGMWWTEGDGGISRITNWWVTGGIALPTWTLALLPSR